MSKWLGPALIAFCSAPGCVTAVANGGDPAVTDGDKYEVLLENPEVRVLRYRDQPGGLTHRHAHPQFVMIALSSFRRRLTFADGSTRARDFPAGTVELMPAQVHTGENIGTTPTDVVLVELKNHAGARSQ